jgi:hypothetical protein
MDFFKNYPPVHRIESGNTLYADVINHCRSYKNFIVSGSKISTCHETSHGCSSEIRNSEGGKVNGFYVGNNRAAVIPEPPGVRKSDAIPFIPKSLQGGRYNLYIINQREWDDRPLYIYDEFNAYIIAAYCAIDLKEKENYIENGRIIDGPIEFCSYATAILMATAKKNGSIESPLKEFSKWILLSAWSSYFKTTELFGNYSQQDKIYQIQLNGSDWINHREFLKSQIDVEIPTSFVDPDQTPDNISWDI